MFKRFHLLIIIVFIICCIFILSTNSISSKDQPFNQTTSNANEEAQNDKVKEVKYENQPSNQSFSNEPIDRKNIDVKFEKNSSENGNEKAQNTEMKEVKNEKHPSNKSFSNALRIEDVKTEKSSSNSLSSNNQLANKTSSNSLKIDEEAQKKKLEEIGNEAIRKRFEEIRKTIINEVDKQYLDKGIRFYTSDDIVKIRNIDQYIIAKIEGRKAAIKQIIFYTAKSIETGKDTGIELGPDGKFHWKDMPYVSDQNQAKVEILIKAMQDNNISIRSIALAISMITNIANKLYEEALNATDQKAKYDMYVEYTAFAYELSSIVLELLSSFEPKGIESLKALRAEQENGINQVKVNVNKRIKIFQDRLNKEQISQNVFDNAMIKYTNYLNALDIVLEGWDAIFSIMDAQSSWINKVKTKSEDFRDIKADAEVQLDILELTGVARFTLEAIQKIDEITEISNIPLLPIDASLISGLLGLEPTKSFDNSKPVRIEIKNN